MIQIWPVSYTHLPYNFDFLTLRERYDEKELKDALIEKVNNFLMELGTGFAYMGREVRIEVGAVSYTHLDVYKRQQ